jgi:hypothetical protein
MNAPQPLSTPPDCLVNGRGHYVPIASIKPIELMRDKLVRDTHAHGHSINRQIVAFRTQAFADIFAFVELSAEEYGVHLGGKKGNLTFYSFDEKLKVQVAVAEHIVFDERLQAAKQLVDECLTDWTEGGRPEVKALIHQAFQVDKAGNINVGRVLALRRQLETDDERWQRAMRIISDALLVVGSKTYIRLHYRAGREDKWVALPLDVAAV